MPPEQVRRCGQPLPLDPFQVCISLAVVHGCGQFERGGFWIPCPTMPRKPICGTVLIVESAIDALSAWLLPLNREPNFILSTAGATTALPSWLQDRCRKEMTV